MDMPCVTCVISGDGFPRVQPLLRRHGFQLGKVESGRKQSYLQDAVIFEQPT